MPRKRRSQSTRKPKSAKNSYSRTRMTPQKRSAINTFVKEVGPYINRIFLRFASELVTKPILAAGRGARDVAYQGLVEPTLNNIFDALGVPDEDNVRNSLSRYVYRSVQKAPAGYAVQEFGPEKDYFHSVVMPEETPAKFEDEEFE